MQVMAITTRARDMFEDLIEDWEGAIKSGQPLSQAEIGDMAERLKVTAKLIAEVDDAVTLSVKALRIGVETGFSTKHMKQDFERLYEVDLSADPPSKIVHLAPR